MTKATETQVGGSHYKDMGIQPVSYIHANKLSFLEGNVVKYITRHKAKNGRADVEKAIHYCQLILELEYGVGTADEKPVKRRGRPPLASKSDEVKPVKRRGRPPLKR